MNNAKPRASFSGKARTEVELKNKAEPGWAEKAIAEDVKHPPVVLIRDDEDLDPHSDGDGE